MFIEVWCENDIWNTNIIWYTNTIWKRIEHHDDIIQDFERKKKQLVQEETWHKVPHWAEEFQA